MIAVNQKFAVGQKVRFAEERCAYTIQAMDGRYAICTRPIYVPSTKQHTVLYTIIDNETWMRGPNNLVFNAYDYKLQEECERSLSDLQQGHIELSQRHSIPVLLKDEA